MGSLIEVELKFCVPDVETLIAKLVQLQASDAGAESHCDTYFRHPCRDFAATREALRIRRITRHRSTKSSGTGESVGTIDEPDTCVTYKGAHLPGNVKARRELEWSLEASDQDGANLQSLLLCLGFEMVATVKKQRRSRQLHRSGRDVIVALDLVENVGSYAEIEVLASDENDLEAAREVVSGLAEELGLATPEPRSYLTLLLNR
jgi:adenylate cyclase, class 2